MTGPSSIRRIGAAQYRRTPWKNGGGVTIDIAGEYLPGAEEGGWSGLVWRVGRTRIDVPAPFSDLSGTERILTVIAGRGLLLQVIGGEALDVREPFRPVRFPGDWAIRSVLEDGPVEVLNLIADRRLAAIEVQFPAEGAVAAVGTGDIVLYAPDEAASVTIDGEILDVPGGDAVRFATLVPVEIACRAGRVAVAWIGRR